MSVSVSVCVKDLDGVVLAGGAEDVLLSGEGADPRAVRVERLRLRDELEVPDFDGTVIGAPFSRRRVAAVQREVDRRVARHAAVETVPRDADRRARLEHGGEHALDARRGGRAHHLPASVEAQNTAHRPSVSACQLSNGAERLWRIGSRVWATPARMPPPAGPLGEAATTTRRAGAPDGGGRVLTLRL